MRNFPLIIVGFLLAPFVLLIVFHLVGYVIQLPIYALQYIDIVYTPTLLALFAFLLGLITLKELHELKAFNIFVLVLLILFITFPIANGVAANYISKAAMAKYGKQPEYIDIEFDYEPRRPHSVLLHDGKEYYWSFKKRAFIQGENLRSWI